MKTIVVERLIDGQANAAKAVDVHDVVAEIVEDVVLGQISHHLIKKDHVFVRDVASRHVIVVQSHFLVRTRASPFKVDGFRQVIVGKHVVVNNSFKRCRYSI